MIHSYAPQMFLQPRSASRTVSGLTIIGVSPPYSHLDKKEKEKRKKKKEKRKEKREKRKEKKEKKTKDVTWVVHSTYTVLMYSQSTLYI